MMRAPRRRFLAYLPAALAFPRARAQAWPDAAAAAIRQAQELQRRGRPDSALTLLDRAIAGLAPAPVGDRLALRLVAAQIAVQARLPDRARPHLDAAERLASASPLEMAELPLAQIQRGLAELRAKLGDTAAAEALLDAALPVLARADVPAAAAAANARGIVRRELQRAAAAVADFELSLGLLRRAGLASGAAAVGAFANLAMAHAEAGDPAAALQAALGARRAAGADPGLRRAADLAEGVARLSAAEVTEAEALLARVAEQSPATDPLRGHARLALALARFNRGHMAEAANEAGAALEAYSQSRGEGHPEFGRALHTLGTVRAALGDTAGATALLRRAGELLRASLGGDSGQAQAAEVELGQLALRDGRPAEAEARAEAALAAYARRPPPDQRPIGLATILLGLAAEARGENEAAAARFRTGQMLIEAAQGPDSPDLGFSLVRLGRLLTGSGRLAEAAAPLNRAIAIFARVGGAGSVRLADAVTARAELRARLGDREGALADTQHGLALLRSQLGGSAAAGPVAEAQRRSSRDLFAAQSRLLLELQPGDPGAKAEAFAASQEALATRAGEALRRAALRRAVGPGEVARLLREREGAAEALRQADAQLLTAAARPGAGLAAAAALRDATAERLRKADAALERDDPRYARFRLPQPEPLAEVQAMLDPDEALVAPLVSEAGLLVWVLRRGAAEPIQEPMREAELARLVDRLRAGLDPGRRGGIEPFDSTAAKRLHAALLGGAQARGLLQGVGHLILVPDGALQRLPPHVLRDADAKGKWLIERYAVTIAPSVAAAAAARAEAARPSAAPFGFLGVADPVFRSYAGAGAGVPSAELRRSLAALPPLRGTKAEVRQLARQLGAPQQQSRILLGEAATERGLLEARPGRFRVIALSSHAVMAGELPGLEEPAVILTPGRDAPPLDGLLTASDIAAMELDAELVLLSACNTAAGDGSPHAEGLSGLARAFLQAGARALLVSHWSVDAAAAAALLQAFAEQIRAAPGRRRAEALRLAMIAGAFRSPDQVANPGLWAPFVVVGS